MDYRSQNPATGAIIGTYPAWDDHRLEQALSRVEAVRPEWQGMSVTDRGALLRGLAVRLRAGGEGYARLITEEMGKPIREARAEIEKCALGCEFFAERGPELLADEPVASDACTSYVAWQPLGTVLAVMPWNFPFWQVIRFAAPALVAGNCALLKHAPNVPRCAEALEALFLEAGFPAGCSSGSPSPTSRRRESSPIPACTR